MSVTDPKTYYWVGGSTGTTSASRFDWNNASNWRVKINEFKAPSDTNLITPDAWPIGGDVVNLGYGREYFPATSSSNSIKSPLLFGGFSGAGNSGCWICGGETGSGLSGASGTTFQAQLKSININWYPYEIVGGGLTGNAHRPSLAAPSELNSMNVTGMNTDTWTALAAAATTKQTSLKVKVANIILNSINSNETVAGSPQPSLYFDIVDCFDKNLSGSTGYIVTNFEIANSTHPYNGPLQKPEIYLSGCKLMTFKKKGIEGYVGYTASNPVSVYGKNVKIAEMFLPTLSDVVFDSDCMIGKLWMTSKGYTASGPAYQEKWGNPILVLSGTYKYYNTLRALGYPGATLAQDESEILYQHDIGAMGLIQPDIKFGGISGGNGITFSANEIDIQGNPPQSSVNSQFKAYITSRASIGTMHLTNTELRSEMYGSKEIPIEINSLLLNEYGSANFRYDPSFNNWRFGVALASTSGLTLNGGIQFNSNTSSILGDPGMRFINYGQSIARDIRNNKTLDLSTAYVPPEAV